MSEVQAPIAPPTPHVARVQIDQPGIYDITAADYHADPCPQPSLSRSVAKVLVDLSPAHAHAIHPRLGRPSSRRDDDAGEAADFGSAAHSEFLLGRSIIKRLDYSDWRTNAAKSARADAFAAGLVPLLPNAYENARQMLDRLFGFQTRTGAFTKGKGEQTVIWREDNGVWGRALADWLPDEPSAPLWDLKTTAGRATLASWSRVCFDKGSDLQASFYNRGVEMVRGEPPGDMHFCVIEQKPPYGIGVFVMSEQAREAADEDARLAIRLWGECLTSGEWPSYPIEEQWVYPPSWVTRGREERGAERKRLEQTAWSKESPLAVRMVESGDFG